MKAIKNFCVGVVTAVLITVSAVAADSSGIFTLPAPGPVTGSDFENPIVSSRTAPVGIPSAVAVGTLGLFTNFNFRIVRDSDVTISLFGNNAITNLSASSNQSLIVELSPDGRSWATNSPITKVFQPIAATAFALQWTIPATNFGVNAYGRIRGLTNSGATGNGSIFPSNAVVTTWRIRRN